MFPLKMNKFDSYYLTKHTMPNLNIIIAQIFLLQNKSGSTIQVNSISYFIHTLVANALVRPFNLSTFLTNPFRLNGKLRFVLM